MKSCTPEGMQTVEEGTWCGFNTCSQASPWDLNVIPRFVSPAQPFLARLGRARRACTGKPVFGLCQSLTCCAFIAAVGDAKAGVKPSSPWCWIRPVTGRVA